MLRVPSRRRLVLSRRRTARAQTRGAILSGLPLFFLCALLTGLITTPGCKSGGGGGGGGGTDEVSNEDPPVGAISFGFNIPFELLDPITANPSPAREIAAAGGVFSSGVQDCDRISFFAFTTTAAADRGSNGRILDPEAPSDNNDTTDVYLAAVCPTSEVLDVVLVSQVSGSRRAGNGPSGSPSIVYVENPGATGLGGEVIAGFVYVAFESDASDLVASDTNGVSDVFRATIEVVVDNGVNLRLASSDPMVRVSLPDGAGLLGGGPSQSTGASFTPAISPTADHVAFESEDSNLLSSDVDDNGRRDIFVRRISTQSTQLVNRSNVTGLFPTGGDSLNPAFEAVAGEVIAFESAARNLVAGDTNGSRDVFYVFTEDLGTGSIRRASVQTGGDQASGGPCRNATVYLVDRDNGEVQVAFESEKSDLVAELGSSGTTHVYLYDSRAGGKTFLIDQVSGPEGSTFGSRQDNGPADSFWPAFRQDGSALAYQTLADNLDIVRTEDNNGVSDVMIADLRFLLSSGHLRSYRISVAPDDSTVDGASVRPVIGTYRAGDSGLGDTPIGVPQGDYVTFRSESNDFDESNNDDSIFSFLVVSDVERVSKKDGLAPSGGGEGDRPSSNAEVTGDNRFVAFVTETALDENRDTNEVADIYVRDLYLGRTILVSHSNGSSNAADGASGAPCVSLDDSGNLVVAFESLAQNLINGFEDRNGSEIPDVFLANFAGYDGRNSSTIDIELVSRALNSAQRGGTEASIEPTIKGRGDSFWVAFSSNAQNLVTDFVDRNGDGMDIYLREMSSETIQLVTDTGAGSRGANGSSSNPSIAVSELDVVVAYESMASDLVGNFRDENEDECDVFVFSMLGDNTRLVSASTAGPLRGGEFGSFNPCVHVGDEGILVAFDSRSSNLVEADIDTLSDIFLRLVDGPSTELLSVSNGGDKGNGDSFDPCISSDGMVFSFESLSSNLASQGDTNNVLDIYLRDRDRSATQRLSRTVNGAQSPDASRRGRVGSSGGIVVFESFGALFEGDENGQLDVYRAVGR